MVSKKSSSPDLLLQRLKKNVGSNPEKNAVTFLSNGSNGGKVEKQFTYKSLEKEVNSVAQRLVDAGINKGDRVVLVYPPSLDFMIAFLACLKASIVAVPVFPPNPTRKDTIVMFSGIVEKSGSKVALTSVSYNHMKKLAGLKDTFKSFKNKKTTSKWPEDLKWIVTNDGSAPSKSWSDKSMKSPVATDLAFLQYTSGSTSEPKGVMITHGNLAHNLSIITNELKAVDDTIVVSWLPQYHDMGLIGSYLGVLYCGGSGYYMSPLSFLQRPMMWMEAVSKYRGTHLQAPNFAFKVTSRKLNPSDYSPDTLNLSSIRHIINAAEPVDEPSILAFEGAFKPFGLKDGVLFPTYGLAEHTVFVCSGGKQRLTVGKEELEVDGKVILKKEADGNSPSTTTTTRLIGCGYPAHQTVDVRIVDTETMKQVGADTVGEIWIRSPSKAAGYFGQPDETKNDFMALLDGGRDDEEFLRTGDLGFLHKEELFICGRLKDLIIVGGRNYYPQDLESTAEVSSDLVRPGCSAAFTIDSTQEGGEEVALVMELREVPKGKNGLEVCGPLANTIRTAINAEHSLGISQLCLLKPRTVPKTTSGKIARAWCRKGFLASSLEVVYRKSFKDNKATSFEIEQGASSGTSNQAVADPEKVKEIRAMDKKDLVAKLTSDIAQMGSIPQDIIKKDEGLVTMLDSLTITQFKGLLETGYGTKLSDEYLFRESTTLVKLADVVKLGYAPDDDGDDQAAGSEGDGASRAAPAASPPSAESGGGIAGALGCPPGVVCCTVM